jgi:hypothetical protein
MIPLQHNEDMADCVIQYRERLVRALEIEEERFLMFREIRAALGVRRAIERIKEVE